MFTTIENFPYHASDIPPRFIIIGSKKCGTTALSYFLNQHPLLKQPPQNVYMTKELHFFDNLENYSKGYSWYLEQGRQ